MPFAADVGAVMTFNESVPIDLGKHRVYEAWDQFVFLYLNVVASLVSVLFVFFLFFLVTMFCMAVYPLFTLIGNNSAYSSAVLSGMSRRV